MFSPLKPALTITFEKANDMAIMQLKPLPKTLTPKAIDRFWQHVRRGGPDECWPWTGAKLGNGYGVYTQDRVPFGSHRIAYLIQHGDPGVNQVVYFKCSNRTCMNGAHLTAGTSKQKTALMIENKRAPWIRNPQFAARGAAHGMAKLTPEQVQEIRALVLSGLKIKLVAKMFNVAYSTVWKIKQGIKWKALPAPRVA